ncbi:hypothetical protein KBA41_10635 [Candidatus Ozemobacteraceae bacterium]|nr:hypothetical protein [Candidatus Ozemobacteraceae bacterium]
MKFRLPLLALMVTFLLYSLPVMSQSAILVDTRLLVAAHPLFRDFDPSTHRFRGTSSEPILGGFTAMKALSEEITRLQAELNNWPKALAQKLAKVPSADRFEAEKAFLIEKKAKEEQLETMMERLFFAVQLPGRPGWTPNHAIFPQTRAIARDMQTVIRTLQHHYRVPAVIDIASLYPYPPKHPMISPDLVQNGHFLLWHGNFTHPGLLPWLLEAKRYWADRETGSSIVPFGARDVRLESIKLLETTHGRRAR